MEEMFELKLTGAGSIESEYQHFNAEVHKATQAGVRAFASELTPCLQKHIQTEVYSAYTPEAYERRHDHPEYGQSIYDSGNMSYSQIDGWRGVEFTYEPNGKNAHYPYADRYLDGDSIISVIQQDKGYLWLRDGTIGVGRPFWDKFVQEVHSQGEDWFVRGFNGYSHDVQAQSDGHVTDKSTDFELNPTGEVRTFR